MINLAIADNETLFREGLVNILSGYPHINVSCSVSDGKHLLAQINERNIRPDIFIIELRMNPLNGIETTKLLNQKYSDCKVIILTSHYSPSFVNHMVKIGVNAFLPKRIHPNELIFAIDVVEERGLYLTEDYSKAIRSRSKKIRKIQFSRHDNLTKKELEVLRWICHGYTNQEISDKVFRSVRTIEGHRQHLIEKTGAKNTAGLVVYALANKLIDIDEKLLEYTLSQHYSSVAI